MIELELYYKTAESEIRRKHIEYLRKQKCLPEGLSVSKSGVNVETVGGKKTGLIGFLKRLFRVNNAVKVKRYNMAVDMSLKVLKREYKRLTKLIEKAEENGGGVQ